MAKLTIGGREIEIAPYKLGDLRKAAPFIDRINNTAITSIEGMVESSSDIIAVLAIGIGKVDPELTAEVIEEQVGFEDLPGISAAFAELLAESGFKPAEGEATAPTALPEQAAGASSSSSADSSTNSSQPA